MEDKIFDIITDLIRHDIRKEEAIDKLLALCSDLGGKATPVAIPVTTHDGIGKVTKNNVTL